MVARSLSVKPRSRPAMVRLAASRLTSHSQGPGRVSSKSLRSKTRFRSAEAKTPKLLRWASPQAWTFRPERGVLDRSDAMIERGAPVEGEGRDQHPAVADGHELLHPRGGLTLQEGHRIGAGDRCLPLGMGGAGSSRAGGLASITPLSSREMADDLLGSGRRLCGWRHSATLTVAGSESITLFGRYHPRWLSLAAVMRRVPPSGVATGLTQVRTRIQRNQLDVEIPEDLERAVEPGLISDPPDQGCRAVLDTAHFESFDRRDQGRAQRSFDLDADRSRTQFRLIPVARRIRAP